MDWLRLWHDMPTDPKWRTIARASGQPLACVIALFNLVMVNASSNADFRGTLSGWVDEDAASALDMEPEAVRAIMDAMQGRVLDGERLAGWERRQPKREDANGSNRVAEHRKRKAADMKRNVTQCNAPEKDTDTDTDTERTTLRDAREPVEIVVEPAKAQSLVSPEALALADELAVICGHELEFVPPAWCGAGMWVQKCLSEGWTPDEMREGTRAVVARGRQVDSFRYLEKPLADFVARNRTPLHVGEARGQGPPGWKNGARAGNLVDASDRLMDRLKEFTNGNDGTKNSAGRSVEAGAASVRLLSQERRG